MDEEDVVCVYIYTHTYTQWDITQPSKEENICSNMIYLENSIISEVGQRGNFCNIITLNKHLHEILQ